MKNKILVYSATIDEITDNVTDWVKSKGYEVLRLNGKDFVSDNVEILISNSNNKNEINSINFDSIGVFWFRKGESIDFEKYFLELDDVNMKKFIIPFLFQEGIALKNAVYKLKGNSQAINYNSLFGFNKIYNLNIAVQSNLKVPATLITSQKNKIVHFKKNYKTIITKPISENLIFKTEEDSYSFYTSEVSSEIIEEKDNVIFPVLIQEKIEKIYEVRVFFLNGIIYSMAILSKELDYRKEYGANRYLLYELPGNIKQSIVLFMKKMKLESGMIDLIKSKNGDYVFLEVNPSGQFSDMSENCNLYLEEIFSNELIKMTNHD